MGILRLFLVLTTFSFVSCSSGLKIIHLGNSQEIQWRTPYVDNMNGVENLTFDGKGSLFVTDLNGTIYLVEPTEDPFRGKVVKKKKLGKRCMGIEVGSDGLLYVGVEDNDGNRKIVMIKKDLSEFTPLSNHISGLNGFASDGRGYLYFTSSNQNYIYPKGKIYRVNLKNEKNFKNPEIVVDKAGMVNGLSFSPDGSILYYSETLNGIWAFYLESKEKKKIFSPNGILQIVDDLATSPDGTVWFCFNSEQAIVPLKNKTAETGYRVGNLGAPSSCKFGNGPGFESNFLYITELGLKGRSLKMNGRGVWVLPVKEIKN